jgi:hypothetical protein
MENNEPPSICSRVQKAGDESTPLPFHFVIIRENQALKNRRGPRVPGWVTSALFSPCVQSRIAVNGAVRMCHRPATIGLARLAPAPTGPSPNSAAGIADFVCLSLADAAIARRQPLAAFSHSAAQSLGSRCRDALTFLCPPWLVAIHTSLSQYTHQAHARLFRENLGRFLRGDLPLRNQVDKQRGF